MKTGTRVNHPPRIELPSGNRPMTFPIHQSVKFEFDTYQQLKDGFAGGATGGSFFYSRVSNPTVRQLEKLLAELQGRQDALAVGSGVASISCVLLALLKAGDHVTIFFESYKPTRYLVRGLLGRFGVTSSLLPLEDLDRFEADAKARPPKMVIFESPTNPSLKIADLDRLLAIARSCGAITVMDNTFAGFHNHGRWPVDVFIHSLTKFAGGHGDVMGGAIIADEPLLSRIRRDAMQIGPALDPHAAYLILRGMKTYSLRYERQCENALAIARFLEQDPRAERVIYPGLPSHPQHALAAKQMSDFGGMVCFDLKAAPMELFLDRLKLFKVAASLGSTESLAAPCLAFYADDLADEERRIAWITPSMVRLSVGIEQVDDLIQDLGQALG